ncbi:MAG: portal protein [Candidatus Aquicultor sp.]
MAKKKINHEDMDTIARYSNLDLQLITDFEPFFNEVSDNFNLLAGHIMSQNDLKKLGLEKRPAFKTNLFMPIMLRILGDFKGNIPGLEFLPRTPKDQDKCAIIKEVNDYAFYQANKIEYELAKAFLFASVGRITWMRQDFTYNYDNEGMVEIEHYHPFLKYDRSLSKRNLRDCQFIFDDNWLTPDEIIRRYAKNNDELKGILQARIDEILGGKKETMANRIYNYLAKLTGAVLDYGGEKAGYDYKKIWTKDGLVYDKNGTWLNNGRFRVTDAYVRQDFPKLIIVDKILQKKFDFTDEVKRDDIDNVPDPNNWIDNAKLQLIKDALPDKMPYIREESESKIIQTSICPGLNIKLYDGLQQLQNGNFKFTMIQGYDFHPDVMETKSIIDNIKDSVKSYNLRDNTNLTYLLRSTHLEWQVEDQYKNKVGDLSSNKIGGVRFVPQGSLTNNAIKRIDPPPPNVALERYQQQKWEEAKTLTGINENAMSRQESTHESGKLFDSRVQQSEIMQEWISENAQAALPVLAENNIYFFQKFFTDERTLRIIGEDGKIDWLVLNQKTNLGEVKNDISVGKFDVIISRVPFGRVAKENDKERNLELLQITSKIPGFDIINQMLAKEIIKSTNLQVKGPIMQIIDAVIKKQVEALQGGDQNDPAAKMANQVQQMMMELELKSKEIANQQEAIQNEGMSLDNEKKRLELQTQQEQLGQVMEMMKQLSGQAPLKQPTVQPTNQGIPAK